MRIYNRDLTGTGTAESGRAQEAQKPERSATAASSGSGSGSGDRVELSSGLASVSRALGANNSDRTNRVQQLTAEFGSGDYQPNSLATSQGIVAEAISSGAR
jgi:hypothetical protein